MHHRPLLSLALLTAVVSLAACPFLFGGSDDGDSNRPRDGGGNTGNDGGTLPGGKAACEAYLDCLAQVDPTGHAEAMGVYGPGGSCWGDGGFAESCATACATGYANLAEFNPGIRQCAQCLSEGDCTAPLHCETGKFQCVECRGAGDCASQSCDLETNTCRECSVDNDCGLGRCRSGTCERPCWDALNKCYAECPDTRDCCYADQCSELQLAFECALDACPGCPPYPVDDTCGQCVIESCGFRFEACGPATCSPPEE